ncbi:hypothetical protein GCM10010350_82420 [Streptomyces galilaeus]|nr:hypothetical protein GCM10010350_82420 [Streptomyces galilaeus]
MLVRLLFRVPVHVFAGSARGNLSRLARLSEPVPLCDALLQTRHDLMTVPLSAYRHTAVSADIKSAASAGGPAKLLGIVREHVRDGSGRKPRSGRPET